jgi:hypothetical protein
MFGVGLFVQLFSTLPVMGSRASDPMLMGTSPEPLGSSMVPARGITSACRTRDLASCSRGALPRMGTYKFKLYWWMFGITGSHGIQEVTV